MRHQNGDTTIGWLILLAFIVVPLICYFRRRQALTAFGTAKWASDKLLRAWHMLGNHGLILARTLRGAVIRIPRYCHVLLIGTPGSGKGVSIIIPNLLDYICGSLVVFDPKGDLFRITARHRYFRRGQCIVRLDPFGEKADTWNPLDTIAAESPLLIDDAGAMAEALVVKDGGEQDPHWNQKASQIIKALLVFVLTSLKGAERSLNSVQEIASDLSLLAAAADRLRKIGGIPARLGNHIKAMFEKDLLLTKEGSGIMSTVVRHLSFLDSQAVAKSVASSTFDARSLLKPGTTLYLTIPPSQLEAQKGLLRLWVSTLIREIGTSGSEERNEVLMLLDEASALGGLAAVEEALVRGRSAGVRMLLAYQSYSQVWTAFNEKKSLIEDNCATLIHLGPPSTFEGAERLSKSLGDWTNVVESEGDNCGGSVSRGDDGKSQSSWSWGRSTNRTQQGRALMRPEELLTMGEGYLIAFQRGLPAPIRARRIKYYEDPAFTPSKKGGVSIGKWRIPSKDMPWVVFIGIAVVIFVVMLARAKIYGYGIWTPETPPAVASVANTIPEKRGYIGIVMAKSFEEEDAAELGLDGAEGVLVKEVYPDSPAAAAGMRAGDVVLGIGGVAVRNKEDLIRLVGETPPGKRIQLQLWREGQMTCAEAEVWDRSKFQSFLNSKP